MSRVHIVTPHTHAGTSGNATTALRWARRLRELKHTVRITARYDGEPCDLLLALHARKSAVSIQRFHALYPRHPLIVALTGTDVYRDLARFPSAEASLERATRIVVLQKLALHEIAARHRRKAVVILQSVVPPTGRELQLLQRRRARARANALGRRSSSTGRLDPVDIVLLANLRDVKDPLRIALATRRLPATSRIRVVHAGAAMSDSYRRRAERETQTNARYQWLGPVSPRRARGLLLGSDALVLSSRLEGGANVLSEAITCQLPVLASRIPGSVGLLGRSYPGYFPVGDTAALATLLERFENEPRLAPRMQRHVRALAPQFTPARERAAWRSLLRGLL